MLQILQKTGCTSDHHIFHRMGGGVMKVLQAACDASGHSVRVERASSVLAIIKADETAELYLDTVAITIQVRLKAACEAGQPVMSNQLTDILSLEFPAVDFDPTDQIIFVFREGFRFGLYFDLTRQLDVREMGLSLGAVMRQVKHSEAYSALTNAVIFDAMNAAGWFPFIEIQSEEFSHIYTSLLENRELDKVEKNLVGAFKRDRLEAMFGRWMAQPVFKKREGLLRPGIEAFLAGEPVPAIKTLATEIEGIIQEAHISEKRTSAKTPGLIDFAVSEASRKSGEPDTLFFAEAFKGYLQHNVYQPFDLVTGTASAWRHGTAHGAAPVEAYTLTRALQVILTLDQLHIYLL